MSVSVKATAPGKVNLYFAVGPLKPDGYHDVASLYAAVDILETVTLTETDVTGISQSMSVAPGSPVAQQVELGAFDPSVVPLDNTNLAYRGAAAVLAEAGLSPDDVCLHLHIEKAVPVAGGMGGGSADAAAAMKAMNSYLVQTGRLSQELPHNRLLQLAAPLGADVPFALLGGLAVGQGIGDRLQAIPLPVGVEPLHFGFVPAVSGLSTPEVFRELDAGRASGRYPAPGENLEVPQQLIATLTSPAPLTERLPLISSLLRNDLASPALNLLPELEQTLAQVAEDPDVAASFVSGSGPTIAVIKS